MDKIIFFFLIGIVGNCYSQNRNISLWHGNVPGAIVNKTYHQSVDSLDNWIKMKFVTEPSLDMYPAPKEKSTGTAVIVCPGGGYWALAIAHEGAVIAKWFNDMGVTAFVLKYRLPDDAIMEDKSIGPLQDAQRAMRLVRQNAQNWGVKPDQIGIMGFSAGGHLASTISTHFDDKVYESNDSTSARPDFSLLIYPVVSMKKDITHLGSRFALLGNNPSEDQINRFSNEMHVCAQTPPAFIIHSMDDDAVPVQNSINYAIAMQKHHVPCELHIFQSGGHGYGLGKSNNTEVSWPEICRNWMQNRGLLKIK